MRLWTVQDKAAYDDLCEKGVLHCDIKLAEWLKYDDFKRSYDWLASEMKERVGLPLKDVVYPIWAWYLLGGKNVKPDFRRVEFRNYLGEQYVIEVEIADDDVLLSDEEMWHFILNDDYFTNGLYNDDPSEYEADEAWFESLPFLEQEQVKRESWKKVFDKTCNPWVFVQATFWELRKEQIVSIRKFVGKQDKIIVP
ncbi:MAG: DUF3841 domain-containing protein [Clostridiales Family XIII bacterium]|jgi:hypothetical protein|nr:DUF3841 domain-containing protein [Clostridiales Family XIII bacterium]